MSTFKETNIDKAKELIDDLYNSGISYFSAGNNKNIDLFESYMSELTDAFESEFYKDIFHSKQSIGTKLKKFISNGFDETELFFDNDLGPMYTMVEEIIACSRSIQHSESAENSIFLKTKQIQREKSKFDKSGNNIETQIIELSKTYNNHLQTDNVSEELYAQAEIFRQFRCAYQGHQFKKANKIIRTSIPKAVEFPDAKETYEKLQQDLSTIIAYHKKV